MPQSSRLGRLRAEAYAGLMARLVGINHVVLEVDDLEEALAFYGRVFELEFRGRLRGMAFLDMGDQFLVLAEGRTQPPDGSRHFGLVVDDRDEVRRLLEQTGVVLGGMELAGLGKSEAALRELREKGLV